MPGIDRSTRPEVLVRFREEFDLGQEGFGRDFGLSLATVQRYEARGAPRWPSYAMVGWSVVEGRIAPEKLRPFCDRQPGIRFRTWPPARDPLDRWRWILGTSSETRKLTGHARP